VTEGDLAVRNEPIHIFLLAALLAASGKAGEGGYLASGLADGPYQFQVSCNAARLASDDASVRAGAAEALGFLRAYDAADALAERLTTDPAPSARRDVALALAWCGSRKHVPALLDALGDPEWTVAQSAWVALTNLTGMELPFDALATSDVRTSQRGAWREWWHTVPPDRPPVNVVDALGQLAPGDLASGCPVSVSSTYKGPPEALTGPAAGLFWQTKNVPFPQWCMIDLGKATQVGCVVVTQFDSRFCMTEYAVSLSQDGEVFHDVCHRKETSPVELVVTFPTQPARYVRVTSFGTLTPTYPTTFRHVRVWPEAPLIDHEGESSPEESMERAACALGAMGGEGAANALLSMLTPYAKRSAGTDAEKRVVRAAIRALGRLRNPQGASVLIEMLRNPQWARYAAEALGDIGGAESAGALIGAYSDYAVDAQRKRPRLVPVDDRPGFEAVDRMYQTPHAIASALSRFPFDAEDQRARLRQIGLLLVANLPGDFDGAMLYEPEAHHLFTAYLLETAGVRRAYRDAALEALGAQLADSAAAALPADERATVLALAKSAPGAVPFAAAWLCALSAPGERMTELLGLLEHANGWARINAAKALMFTGQTDAVGRIAELLAASKTEAEHGYNGKYLYLTAKAGQDEYNAPAPCWREAFTRALGWLGSHRHVPLLVRLLNDDRNVLEVRYAAAVSLARIGGDQALDALAEAETGHPFHSVRLVAREALWRNSLLSQRVVSGGGGSPQPDSHNPNTDMRSASAVAVDVPLVFIKGANIMPNRFQIDIWRQSYSTSDTGPTYRPGRNLYRLSSALSDGVVTPLTMFEDGYVADCEVSWDGSRIVFSHRGGDADPWWHLWEVGADGTGLRQLTDGPYHDVQPVYLPDGRIVFSTTRIGMRDEYHGYPATGLAIANADGADIQCIGFNLGRDNEPTVLADGRIGFSRLELFYSRLKTEITVQAVFPDGTNNVTLYGPERRGFWRDITRASGERNWGEVPPRHRVLRLTQPQALGFGRVICATTGGATLIGPGRMRERVLPRFENMAVTCIAPLGDKRALCAATVREFDVKKVDLGLYMLDLESGELAPIYNDPATADFEPRALVPRLPPRIPATAPGTNEFTARLLCGSALVSRDAVTRNRGRLVRIVEGQPVVGRHHSHTSRAGQAWKNHTGTNARILGTVPLAADGSFSLEIPADRLVHCQILDSDRQVVGNQLIWMYARPGETRSCVGCHEPADSAAPAVRRGFAQSARVPPVPCLPSGDEFTYRAKAWRKGTLTLEAEERTRTTRAINLMARE